MYRVHNSPTGGNLGITRTTEEFRKRFYCPNYVEMIADYIRNCSRCLQMKQRQPSKPRTPPQEVLTLKSFPGDPMQIDILGPFPSSPYKYALTAIEVFTKYLFAVPLTIISAVSVATASVSHMFQHSYIPQGILSDLGTQFVSDLFHELTQLLEIKTSHASLKHPQTIGVVERAHAALTRTLKLNSNQSFTNWYKFLNLATFIHNTSYHTSIGCAPTVIFHERDPMKPMDIRSYSNCIQKLAFNYDFVESLPDELLKKIRKYKRKPGKIFQQILKVL